jgi:hypothetical protein
VLILDASSYVKGFFLVGARHASGDWRVELRDIGNLSAILGLFISARDG